MKAKVTAKDDDILELSEDGSFDTSKLPPASSSTTSTIPPKPIVKFSEPVTTPSDSIDNEGVDEDSNKIVFEAVMSYL